METGDSSNSIFMSFMNHSGTHVDAPRHMLSSGHPLNNYLPEDWIFTCPRVLDISVTPDAIIPAESVAHVSQDEEVDLVLLRTGFEQHRGTKTYWAQCPVLSMEACERIHSAYPEMQAIGLDLISVSSPNHSALGGEVHRFFFSRGIRIFEDMRMSDLSGADRLQQVIALPLMIKEGDGAPCTIMGILG